MSAPRGFVKYQTSPSTMFLTYAEYSDRGIVTTLVDTHGVRLRLHLTVVTSELLCERIANALERQYGE